MRETAPVLDRSLESSGPSDSKDVCNVRKREKTRLVSENDSSLTVTRRTR